MSRSDSWFSYVGPVLVAAVAVTAPVGAGIGAGFLVETFAGTPASIFACIAVWILGFVIAIGTAAWWTDRPRRKQREAKKPRPEPETEQAKYQRMATEQRNLARTFREHGMDDLAAAQDALADQCDVIVRSYWRKT